MAVEQPWPALARPSLTLFTQMGIETTPLPFSTFLVRTVSSFQSGGAFAAQRALTMLTH